MESFNVLLVDDETQFLEPLVKRLKKRGLVISTANSGEAALAVYREQKIDVTVLDVRMPGLDGIQTLKEIKKIDPLTEVILLTGHASVDIAIEGIKLGAFDYLMKPAEIDELFYKLQDAYKKRSIRMEKHKTP